MTRLRFRPAQRLKHAADFQRVYDRRNRAADQWLLIFADRSPGTTTRIGLSVSRKHGGAVRRNRLKRLLREAFRLTQHELPAGLDLILIPKQGSEADLLTYQRSLRRLTAQLARRLGLKET